MCQTLSRRPKSERLDQLPCYTFFPKMYIFTRARNQGTRFGKWIRKVMFVIYLMPFAGKYYTLYIWYSDKKHYQFLPSPPVLQQRTHKVTLRSKALERGLSQTPRLPGRPCLHSSWTAGGFLSAHLTSASPTLDFRPHPPVPDSGPYPWCTRPREALGRRATRQAGGCGPSAHSTKYPLPSTRDIPVLHPFLPPISYPNQLLQALCFLFRRTFAL